MGGTEASFAGMRIMRANKRAEVSLQALRKLVD
jgi:hypothetical protein